MDVKVFSKYEFFAGVPDSQLKPLCDWLFVERGISGSHIVAPNEGSAVACAAGYYLATGKVPCVYLQNSGIGNMVNPVLSLLSHKVYGIPMMFIVGWRGEPDIHDEPQHVLQGKVTVALLEQIGIYTFVLSKDTAMDEFKAAEAKFEQLFAQGKCAAFVVRRGGLTFDGDVEYPKRSGLMREEIIRRVTDKFPDAIIVCTTGKASRELFEIREQNGQMHGTDFYTVGSMGHASAVAFGIAMQRPERRVIVIDGDGAALMHMGTMALIGANGPSNLIHIVINNASHESVGGMPTVAGMVNLAENACACGYSQVYTARESEELDTALGAVSVFGQLSFIEVHSMPGSRDNLGRPTVAPQENKKLLMENLFSAFC